MDVAEPAPSHGSRRFGVEAFPHEIFRLHCDVRADLVIDLSLDLIR
jgi:hypothetical protein